MRCFFSSGFFFRKFSLFSGTVYYIYIYINNKIFPKIHQECNSAKEGLELLRSKGLKYQIFPGEVAREKKQKNWCWRRSFSCPVQWLLERDREETKKKMVMDILTC